MEKQSRLAKVGTRTSPSTRQLAKQATVGGGGQRGHMVLVTVSQREPSWASIFSPLTGDYRAASARGGSRQLLSPRGTADGARDAHLPPDRPLAPAAISGGGG